jgi:hypothetical protein
MSALRNIFALALVLVAPFAAERVYAQKSIVADVASAWTHAQTGLKLPAALAGFERVSIVQYDNAQRDVAVGYRDPSSRTETTLYVFYAGLPDASVWHDRIKYAMTAGVLGKPDFTTAIHAAFAAPGETVAGGLRTTVPMSGKSAKSSGVAIFAHNGWLIATRMSSATLDRDALDARLAAFVAALPLEAGKIKPSPAYVIDQCTTPLAPPPATAVGLENGPEMSLAVAFGIEAVGLEAETLKPNAARYCRDPVSQIGFGVYRHDGASESYVIAVGDSGTAVTVSKDPVVSELRKEKADYSVFMATVSDRSGFGAFNGLPSYGQTIDMINAHKALVSVSRPVWPDEKANINIFTNDASKKAN